MTAKQELATTLHVVKTPYWAQLAAGLQMAGFKLVPEDLWDGLARMLDSDPAWLVNRGDAPFEFTIHSNHMRSNSHEEWQGYLFQTIADEHSADLLKRGVQLWVVPVDELWCALHEDTMYCDFCQITRLVFVGTEDQMRDAVSNLVNFTNLAQDTRGG